MTEATLMAADTTTDDAASQTAGEDAGKTDAATEQQATTDATTEDKAKEAPADDAAKDEAKEETKEGEDDDAPEGAPEAYEDFTAPEGVELDAEVLEEFKTVAKDLNLPQEAAQKVADLGVQMAQKWADAQTEASTALIGEWRETAKADKEIGGDNLPANLSLAKQAVEKFGTPELSQMLEDYRMGDHPEMIRFFVRVGKAVSEDTFVAGGNTTPEKKSFYPNSKMN